jgi:hypothetical protein
MYFNYCPSPPAPNPPSPPNPPPAPNPPTPNPPQPTPTKTIKIESCTATIAQTYASVWCTKTGTDAHDPCSTQVYSLVTGCSVVGTTTTTTTSINAPATQLPCSPGQCGSGTCAAAKRSMQAIRKSEHDIAKRGRESEGDYLGRALRL